MLHLYQEITLLALKDDKGTVSIENLAQVLAGALAAELILRKNVALSENKKRIVQLLDSTPTGDALLDECIAKLATAKREASLQTWVSRFASIKELHHRAAQSLCELGILKRNTEKVLLIFNRTTYPEINPMPERQILQRLERAIFTQTEKLSEVDAILVSLADASELLNRIYGRKRLKPQRARIKQIVEGEAIGIATREAIEAIQAAMIVAAVIIPAAVN